MTNTIIKAAVVLVVLTLVLKAAVVAAILVSIFFVFRLFSL